MTAQTDDNSHEDDNENEDEDYKKTKTEDDRTWKRGRIMASRSVNPPSDVHGEQTREKHCRTRIDQKANSKIRQTTDLQQHTRH